MRLVGLPEQHGELSRRDIDRMALDHARMGAFAREAQFLGRTGKEFFHGRRQRIRGAGRNQPATFVLLDQLGNPMATWRDGQVVWVRPEDINIDDDSEQEPGPAE